METEMGTQQAEWGLENNTKQQMPIEW